MERQQGIDRGDRTAIWFTAIVATIAAICVVVAAVQRVIEVLTARQIPVLAPFRGERAALPIGPDGADVMVTVNEAVIPASDLAPITTASLVLEAIVGATGILGALACLALLCVNLARGIAFSRANTRLLMLGTVAIIVAWAGGGLFRTMGVNGTFAAVSDRSYDNVLFATDLTPVAIVLTLAAVGTAFGVGERLQRDTEGLV
ncbi:hypothetical protein [Microbacterium sp. NPDC096154]|uniref:hypothetical protein n=1 Tax=Microbacterium sp. NPDC096154 TaxID=3155549 RepID=UPI003316862D